MISGQQSNMLREESEMQLSYDDIVEDMSKIYTNHRSDYAQQFFDGFLLAAMLTQGISPDDFVALKSVNKKFYEENK